jgi:hypothetical protein
MQTRRLLLVVTGLVALTVGLSPTANAELPGGLSGHKVTFRVTSPDVDQACVSYYETTERGGPALEVPVAITLEDLPFKATVGTGTKLRHWHITAYASDDCEANEPPDGTVKCRLRVDGKVKVKKTGTDQLVFCYF